MHHAATINAPPGAFFVARNLRNAAGKSALR